MTDQEKQDHEDRIKKFYDYIIFVFGITLFAATIFGVIMACIGICGMALS